MSNLFRSFSIGIVFSVIVSVGGFYVMNSTFPIDVFGYTLYPFLSYIFASFLFLFPGMFLTIYLMRRELKSYHRNRSNSDRKS